MVLLRATQVLQLGQGKLICLFLALFRRQVSFWHNEGTREALSQLQSQKGVVVITSLKSQLSSAAAAAAVSVCRSSTGFHTWLVKSGQAKAIHFLFTRLFVFLLETSDREVE